MLWTFWKDKTWSKKNRWDIKKISFVAILIATSVSFILISITLVPIAALPSFKLTLGGLPIKLTGYLFGPFVGLITGLLTDIISFLLRPTFFHWIYTLSFMIAGMVPGIVGYFMNRRWRNFEEVEKKNAQKYDYINYAFTVFVLLAVVLLMTWFIGFKIPDEFFQSEEALIKSRWGFYGLAIAGLGTMAVALPFFRFFFKPATFNAIVPIICFSIFLEIMNTPMITLADQKVFGQPYPWEFGNSGWDEYITLLAGHLILTPAKIWFNLVIIMVAYKIVAPLIFNKQKNGW